MTTYSSTSGCLPAVNDDGAQLDGASKIEQAASLTWPASIVEETNGWRLRATPGVTRQRPNSAALPPQTGEELENILGAVEGFYTNRGLPVSIQVAPAKRHTTLDTLLDARGYRQTGATQVLAAPADRVIAATAPHPEATVEIAEGPTASWLDAFNQLDSHDDSAAVGELVLSRIKAPAAYASLTTNGKVAGMGLFVAAHGYTGVFCMATWPTHRRTGIATAILHAGACWASKNSADQLYLQVVDGNAGARKLYERSGFTHSHSYHYRVADLRPLSNR